MLSSAGNNEPEDRAVENLLQRVADGVLAEDRRDALEHLRDLMQESSKVNISLRHLDGILIKVDVSCSNFDGVCDQDCADNCTCDCRDSFSDEAYDHAPFQRVKHQESVKHPS